MYERSFPGLLKRTPNDKPILQYRDGYGTTEVAPEDAKEYYHSDANEKAIEAWNIRVL
jgi:hypothetical protein